MPQSSQARRWQKKVDTKENARVIHMCTFCVTQEITGVNGDQTDLQMSNKSQTNLQKQVYTLLKVL